MKKLVSIILPVYNNEKSIGDTIESVISQKYQNWELIIIDDASTDNSSEVINKFAGEDKRISVLQNEVNKGPAIARNRGLDKAKGEYIGFIDADDIYEPVFLEKMLSTAKNYKAEIVWCQYRIRASKDEVGMEIKNDVRKNKIFENKDIISSFVSNVPGIGSIWNKIYSKEFIEKNNLRLNPDRIRAEDWEFNLIAFTKVQRVVVIEDYLYNYIHQNTSSIMTSFRIKDYEMMIRSIDLLIEINREFDLNKEYREIVTNIGPNILEFFYRGFKGSLYRQILTLLKREETKKLLKNLDSSILPPTYKILFILLKRGFYYLAYMFVRIR